MYVVFSFIIQGADNKRSEIFEIFEAYFIIQIHKYIPSHR